MFQAEFRFSSMVAELLQSIGIELSLFVLTLLFASVFHGYPFRKANKLGTQHLKPQHKVQHRAAAASKHHSPDRKKEDDVFTQTAAPSSTLGQKIKRMIECAGSRHAADAADAINIFEKLKATNDRKTIKHSMTCGKHQPAAVFNLLVHSAGRIGRPEIIEILLDDMKELGIDRSLEFYECTMKMLASKKLYKEAMSVCSRLELDGLCHRL
jgi:hypothetical protein